jgi:two-component system LytT family response regulator
LTSLRVLVIDDEPPARKKLTMLLRQEPGIEIVGEASNGIEAVAAIEEYRPDVVFLDIQMPGMNGFEVLEAIDREHMPLVVFVTAYDQHAVKAFEVHAADYLLKPFDQARLQSCLARLRGEHDSAQSRIKELLDQFRSRDYLTRVVVKSRGRVLFLKMEDVDWIETSANKLELQSGPRQFVRVHRTAIVNIERIQELQPWSHGDFIVILKDGAKLRMSRRYRGNLSEIWG